MKSQIKNKKNRSISKFVELLTPTFSHKIFSLYVVLPLTYRGFFRRGAFHIDSEEGWLQSVTEYLRLTLVFM